MKTDGGGVWAFEKIQWLYKRGYSTGPLRDSSYFLTRTMVDYNPSDLSDNILIAPQLLGFWNED